MSTKGCLKCLGLEVGWDCYVLLKLSILNLATSVKDLKGVQGLNADGWDKR